VAETTPAHRSAVPRSRSLGRAGRRRRRRRRVAGLIRFVVFLLLIFVAVWAGVRVANAGTDASLYTGRHYVVRQGDDLWTIASRHYDRNVDLRKAVFAIRQANGLRSATLQPGQDLRLPTLQQ
jgi:cell division protein YceG involved in septum cleavage